MYPGSGSLPKLDHVPPREALPAHHRLEIERARRVPEGEHQLVLAVAEHVAVEEIAEIAGREQTGVAHLAVLLDAVERAVLLPLRVVRGGAVHALHGLPP